MELVFGISHHVSNQAFMHILSIHMKDDPYRKILKIHSTTYSQLNSGIVVTLCQPVYCPSSTRGATTTTNRPVRWNDTHFLHCQVRQQIVNSICNPWAICKASKWYFGSTNHCANVIHGGHLTTRGKKNAPEPFLLFFDREENPNFTFSVVAASHASHASTHMAITTAAAQNGQGRPCAAPVTLRTVVVGPCTTGPPLRSVIFTTCHQICFKKFCARWFSRITK